MAIMYHLLKACMHTRQGHCMMNRLSCLHCRQDLDHCKLEIQELFGKINEIRRKAEQSELMVQEICRDIKKLDYAKKHLTYTITALRRLAMLINAIGNALSMTLYVGPSPTCMPCASDVYLAQVFMHHCNMQGCMTTLHLSSSSSQRTMTRAVQGAAHMPAVRQLDHSSALPAKRTFISNATMSDATV